MEQELYETIEAFISIKLMKNSNKQPSKDKKKSKNKAENLPKKPFPKAEKSQKKRKEADYLRDYNCSTTSDEKYRTKTKGFYFVSKTFLSADLKSFPIPTFEDKGNI